MYEEASQVANDAVGSIRTVASFCAERKVMDLFQSKCAGPMKKGVNLGLVSGSGFGFSFFALYCTNAFCFYIGALLVKKDKATFGEVFKVNLLFTSSAICFFDSSSAYSEMYSCISSFLQVFFALTIAAIGVSQSTAMAPDSSKARDSAASIFEILDSQPPIDSSSDEGITLPSVKGDIALEHVSFKYPTRPDIQIFRDINLTIPAGKVSF